MAQSNGSSNQGIYTVVILTLLGLIAGIVFYKRTPDIASVTEMKPVAPPHALSVASPTVSHLEVLPRVKVTEQSVVVTSLSDLPKKVEKFARSNPDLEKRFEEYRSQFHCHGTATAICAYMALDLALKRTELDLPEGDLKREFWKGVSQSYADSRSMLLDLADQTTDSDPDVRIAIQKKLSALEYVSQSRKSESAELSSTTLENSDDQFRVGIDPTTQKSTYILYSETEKVDGEPKVLYSRIGEF